MERFRDQEGGIKEIRRGDIWLVVDRNSKHNKKHEFDNSVQGGTRICIVVSNDMINTNARDVEIVYTTTKNKNDLPTHFKVDSTPELSTVLCEQITTVPKKNLKKCFGTLTLKERAQLNRCMKISIELFGKPGLDKPNGSGEVYKRRNEVWETEEGDLCIIVSNDTGNIYSPIVEVVYLTEDRAVSPSHFKTDIAGKTLTGRCDEVMTIPKKDLVKKLLELPLDKKADLNKCLKISLGL